MADDKNSKNASPVDQAIGGAAGLGKMWAHLGLMIGKTAVETGAVTLQKVAEMISHVATNFEDKKKEEAIAAVPKEESKG